MSKNKEALWAQGREIVSNAPQLYVDVDVEADGIAGYGSLLSVGAVTPYGETYYSELRPSSNIFIASNRKFCEEHGLARERLMDEARPFHEVMKEFNDWTHAQRNKVGKRAVFRPLMLGLIGHMSTLILEWRI